MSIAAVIVVLLVVACVWLLRQRAQLRRELAVLELRQTGEADSRRQAIASERSRLLGDLHDDIGAKLLTLIHSLDRPEQADLARAVMQDLRDIVSRSQLEPLSLLEALAQMREETEERLAVIGSSLEWQQDGELPDPPLDEAQALHLFRIGREAVTNALRHGHATHLRIRIRAASGMLLFDLTDDGPGLLADGPSGRGTTGMRRRAEELQGSIAWTAGTRGGTKVVLQFPLPESNASLGPR
ncbi:ATP-binding protein [Nevskia sp.]|uniref:sensor histidine kinase n=1 Tax=Nevskia sp. TaxID=1929292 RepID=UPI0025F1469D|nr:ATP-binding protein [Nevskia sp.]